MFYLGDEMVRQSAGLVLRDQKVADAADMLAAMRDALAKRGIGFLVTVPPNSSTIYQDDLPDLGAKQGKEDGIRSFSRGSGRARRQDGRPAAGDEGGAVGRAKPICCTTRTGRRAGRIAGFNAVVEADGHPEWRLDPATALGPPEERKGGDVARILGVQDDVSEEAETSPSLRQGTDEALSQGVMPDHVVTTGKPGPTIMVIGDSFTAGYFPLMLSQHVGRAIWVHHHQCGFDWKLIDRLRPDEVWWAPTERFLVCDPGARSASIFPEPNCMIAVLALAAGVLKGHA